MKADPHSQIGQRIREARNRAKLTQRQLAAKIGVRYQQIQRYERGEKLSVDRLLVIAEILDAKLDWLTTGQGR
jgi:transcriptional regulator with XRE-family HTH domain